MNLKAHFAAAVHGAAARVAWRCCAIAVCVAIAIGTLTPGNAAATLTASDKADHLLAFAALATACALAFRPGWRAHLGVAAATVAYGACIEAAQSHVPGRHADVADLLADAIGVAFGLALAALVRRLSAP